jgi:hypothetical protein
MWLLETEKGEWAEINLNTDSRAKARGRRCTYGAPTSQESKKTVDAFDSKWTPSPSLT